MTVKNLNSFSYEEIGKKIFSQGNKEYIIQEYQDKFSIDGKKIITGKELGHKFAAINSYFFDYLKEFHIPTAYLECEPPSVRFAFHQRLPFFIKVLNAVDSRISKVFSVKEYDLLDLPVFEYYYMNGKDSIINESHLISFNISNFEEIKLMNRISSKINAVLKSFFERRNTNLIEFNCIFGKLDNKIVVVDDFSPKSLKVKPLKNEKKTITPYKLTTSSDVKNYTDYLLNLISQ